MPHEVLVFTPKKGTFYNKNLDFVALSARVFKSLGCFLTRWPNTIRFGCHRLKARYMGKLESLIELRNNITKNKKKKIRHKS